MSDPFVHGTAQGTEFGVKVEGITAFVRELKELDERLPLVIKGVGLSAALLVAREAVREAPVGNPIDDDHPGLLARSIRFGATPTGAWVSVGSARVLYAGPIIFGWGEHNIEKNLFPFRALDAKRLEVFKLYDEGVSRLVDEVFARSTLEEL